MQEKLMFLFLFSFIKSIHAYNNKATSILNKLPSDEDMLLYWRNEKDGKCKPFTNYFKRCNKCFCNADGVPSCTRIICPDVDEDLSMEIQEIAKDKHRSSPKMQIVPSDDKSHEREKPFPPYRKRRQRQRQRKKLFELFRQKRTTSDGDMDVNYNLPIL